MASGGDSRDDARRVKRAFSGNAKGPGFWVKMVFHISYQVYCAIAAVADPT